MAQRHFAHDHPSVQSNQPYASFSQQLPEAIVAYTWYSCVNHEQLAVSDLQIRERSADFMRQ